MYSAVASKTYYKFYHSGTHNITVVAGVGYARVNKLTKKLNLMATNKNLRDSWLP